MSKGRLLIFGSTGMLGQYVCFRARKEGYAILTPLRKQGECDLANGKSIRSYLKKVKDVDAIINCAGVIQGPAAYMVSVNALAPHRIAESYNGPIFHVSTDCVFHSAEMGTVHGIFSPPNPIGLYARSKLLGEVDAPNVCNIRTSFVGFESGLLRWFLDQEMMGGSVLGFTNALWSGGFVSVVADQLVNMVMYKHPTGVHHLATKDPITKCNLLWMIKNALDLQIGIVSTDTPKINRALVPTVVLPDFASCLDVVVDNYRNPVLVGVE